MKFVNRKPNRLSGYDYSQNGAYFITICVKDRKPILSRIAVGASIARPPKPELTDLGRIIDNAIQAISVHYPDVTVDHYVIMPNHVHMILRIDRDSGRAMLAPTTVSEIIRQMKGTVTKQCGKAFWQRSYYDHIIRDDYDYQIKWNYIENDPDRWCDDEFYSAFST